MKNSNTLKISYTPFREKPHLTREARESSILVTKFGVGQEITNL
jgi:hypothetical protein